MGDNIMRPMGAFERALYWHNKNNPAHFVLVAEINDDLGSTLLRSALAAVQARHPLLSAAVELRAGAGPVFVRPEKVGGIPLRVASDGRTWAEVAGEELMNRVDTTAAPQVRATLLRSTGTSPAAILLTFDHAVADGRSAVVIMRDLFAALNGGRLPALPVPPSLESRVADRGLVASATPAALEAADERMFASAGKDPFGTAPYEITSDTLDAGLTGRLVSRAKTERTTVHATLLSAISTALWRSGRFEYPRVYYPIDVRERLGATDDSGLYLIGARIAFGEDEVRDLWEMARQITPAVERARSSGNLAAATLAAARRQRPGPGRGADHHLPPDVDHAEVRPVRPGRRHRHVGSGRPGLEHHPGAGDAAFVLAELARRALGRLAAMNPAADDTSATA